MTQNQQKRRKRRTWRVCWVLGLAAVHNCNVTNFNTGDVALFANWRELPELHCPAGIMRKNITKTYTVFFFTDPPLKVLSVRLHSKSHRKSSKCQNFLSHRMLYFNIERAEKYSI